MPQSTSEAPLPGREWLVPGAAVVELTDRHHGTASLKYTTVVKVLKRDVVLENGSRFNVHSLVRRLGDWGSTIELLPPDHPKVHEVAHKITERRKLDRARVACSDYERQRNGITAADAIRALAAMTDFADELIAVLDKHA